jgi:hypothetical protein
MKPNKTMKTSRKYSLILLTTGLLGWQHAYAATPAEQDPIAVARSVLKSDRRAVVTEALQLTQAEAGKFWPLYDQYRAEMDPVGDGLLKVVREYAKYYPEVPDDRAQELLKNLVALEKKQVATRETFLKKFGKVLPAAKTLRFAQVENRMDLLLRLQLAAAVPLVPIEGRLSPDRSSSVIYEPGTPGGVAVQTSELTATVAAIDQANRKLTLISPEGIKKTVKVSPEVVNFDQIRVGDQLKVLATQQLVIQMAKPGGSADDGGAALVALAPEGAKPGGVVAGTTQVTATVKAIDPQKHTATLQFEDGSTQTFPVRKDVDLTQRKVGEQVVFRLTEMVAIGVAKP